MGNQKHLRRYIKNVGKKPLRLPSFVSALLPAQNIVLFNQHNSELRIKTKSYNLGDYHRALYTITRFLSPEKVIETGVFHGHSSLAILLAMKENNKGTLYSIDLPSSALPQNKKPGWIVPPDLRGRWDLRLGRSCDLLPTLIKEIGKIDVFLHDSEHTYKNMYFEYETTWACIKKGGLLLSHDISQNRAFRDFSKVIFHKYYYMLHNLGGIRK